MKEEKKDLGLAAAIMGEAMAAQEATEQEAEDKPRRKRKNIMDREPLPGPTGAEMKKKRKRAKKDPELRKSRSISVLMTEQLYQKFKQKAEREELSMNGIITSLIRKYVIAHDIDDNMLDI